MALYIIDGKIGSGKSYYAVRMILKKYCVWDSLNICFKVKDGMRVFTNIDGLKVGEDFDQACKDAGGFDIFFSLQFQQDHFSGQQIIYVIDEAQSSRYFSKQFRSQGVLDFLEL